MSQTWILVDGYSVLHFWPRLRKLAGRSLELQRDVLIGVLRQYGDATGARVTVVFDGHSAKRKPSQPTPTPGVEVLFSDIGKTADDVIERLVGTAAQPGNFRVVTSDNIERDTVEMLGAQCISTEVFEIEVTAALGELTRQVREHSRARRLNSIRSYFDD